MIIVVLGGTGLIGRKAVNLLRERGHEAVAASRSHDVHWITGEDLTEALSEARVVVDVINSPSFEDKAVPGLYAARRLAGGSRRYRSGGDVLRCR